MRVTPLFYAPIAPHTLCGVIAMMGRISTKRYKRGKRLLPRLAIVAAIPILLLFFLDMKLRPVIFSMAEARARAMAVQAINDAVFEIMGQGSLYNDLMRVVLDENDRVSMMQANTARMNELSARTALAVQQNLDGIATKGISIPLGSALGIKLLAGSGPIVQVRVVPVGDVSTEFVSEFTTAGINQTRHRIFLKISANVQMIIPTGTQKASVSSQMPVAEAIIVGDVPETFVDLQSIGTE